MMADFEVKQKKRKISDVFKKKNKENKEELEEDTSAVDIRESGKRTGNSLRDEDDADNGSSERSHERKKKKFGHRRFLSTRKNKSKKELVREEKCEVQKHQAGKNETTETDDYKTAEMEDEKDGFCEEEDNKEKKKDNSDEFPKVQNVQQECESPEDVVQSDGEQRALQTMILNVNQNNKQPLTRGENTKEGSVIRSLLHHGGSDNTSERYSEYPLDSNDKSEPKFESAEVVGRFVPYIFIANLLELVMPSSYTGSPTDTKTDFVYKLVMQTADQTYSTLVNLVNAFLTRAGQIPKQVLVNVLVHLIKKYPQCFKIKKIKRRAVLPDDQVAADTVM